MTFGQLSKIEFHLQTTRFVHLECRLKTISFDKTESAQCRANVQPFNESKILRSMLNARQFEHGMLFATDRTYSVQHLHIHVDVKYGKCSIEKHNTARSLMNGFER